MTKKGGYPVVSSNKCAIIMGELPWALKLKYSFYKEDFIMKTSEKDLENISGGEYAPDFWSNFDLYRELQDDGYEEALECFGAKGTITWGCELNETIPAPNSKNDTFEYNGKV